VGKYLYYIIHAFANFVNRFFKKRGKGWGCPVPAFFLDIWGGVWYNEKVVTKY
jgi:hypothetical protein